MKFTLLLALCITTISHAAEKRHVTINPNAPVFYVPDQDHYTAYQTPPTPEVETESLFEQENRNARERRTNNGFNLAITGGSALTTTVAFFIPDGEDEATNTLKRATIVTSILTCIASSFRTCFDCRKKAKPVANYSRGTTPRNAYPATVSKGPSPLTPQRTLE